MERFNFHIDSPWKGESAFKCFHSFPNLVFLISTRLMVRFTHWSVSILVPDCYTHSDVKFTSGNCSLVTVEPTQFRMLPSINSICPVYKTFLFGALHGRCIRHSSSGRKKQSLSSRVFRLSFSWLCNEVVSNHGCNSWNAKICERFFALTRTLLVTQLEELLIR